MITEGNYVSIINKEIDRQGKVQFVQYSGKVERVFKNGQFLLADNDGTNKLRFEMIAIQEVNEGN